MRGLGFIVAALLAVPAAAVPLDTPASADPSWAAASAALDARTRIASRPRRAKNVILFIGDGMGISTITAARIFAAQQRGRAAGKPESGEENSLTFERLPRSALIKTYNFDAQVPDSAGTASAMASGIKTRIGVLNMRPDQGIGDCKDLARLPRTLGELAKARGLGVGVVSTARLTHATPAAMYAHGPNRNWEGGTSDPAAKERAAGCPDIARQFVDFRAGGGIDVALGGGLDRFVGADYVQPLTGGKGRRAAGDDLRRTWQANFPEGRLVETGPALAALDPAARGNVLGLFNLDHLSYEADRDDSGARRPVEPSLTQMTEFALRKLQRGRRGYVLMVESGRIDHAHHATNRYRALAETVEFDRAIAAALKLVDLRDTLVLVTADHSHVFSMAGYPERGRDILDHVRPPASGGDTPSATDREGYTLDEGGRRFPTLAYANGPETGVIDPLVDKIALSSNLPPTDKNYIPPKLNVLARGETHGGEDVALFADGAGSQPVGGVLDQQVIFHVIARALGWQ